MIRRITNIFTLILLRGVLMRCSKVMHSPAELKLYADRLTLDEMEGVADMDRLNMQLRMKPSQLLKDLRHLKKVLARD